MTIRDEAGMIPIYQGQAISPEIVHLRERLQRVEMEIVQMRRAVEQTGQNSTQMAGAINNRLTSQYQRIAAHDEETAVNAAFREQMKAHIDRLTEEISPLVEIQEEMERTARRRAASVEVIKWAVPIIATLLAVLEKLAPGIISKIGM